MKDKDTVGEKMYSDIRDYYSLINFVHRHKNENNQCMNKSEISKVAFKDYKIYHDTEAMMIAGYIEALQNKINELKQKQDNG